MPTIKRKKVKGAETPPSTSKKGGIIKRRELPIVETKTILPGELGAVVSAIEKDAGINSPFFLGSSKRINTGFVRTGVLAVDLALGGGWRTSRGGMLYGERSAGKTTLALKTVAMAQRMYDQDFAVWEDIEGTFDKTWARKLGVDLDRLLIIEPDSGEEAVDYAQGAIQAKETCIFVSDSIAMLSPMKEVEESVERDFPGLQARLVGKFLRRVNNALIRERKRGHYPVILHLNQFRMKIGIMFGDPRTLPGGKALEFATTQQIEVKNKEHKSTKGDDKGYVLYNEHTINVTKNKSGGPLREAAYTMIRTEGYQGLPDAYIMQHKTIKTLGLKTGILTGANNAFQHEDYGKFVGDDSFKDFLLENPEASDKIQNSIIDYYRDEWGLNDE